MIIINEIIISCYSQIDNYVIWITIIKDCLETINKRGRYLFYTPKIGSSIFSLILSSKSQNPISREKSSNLVTRGSCGVFKSTRELAWEYIQKGMIFEFYLMCLFIFVANWCIRYRSCFGLRFCENKFYVVFTLSLSIEFSP